MNCVEIWSFEWFIFKDMTLVEHMQSSSPQISLIGCPFMLPMCAHPLGAHMHVMPKSIIFVHINITGR